MGLAKLSTDYGRVENLLSQAAYQADPAATFAALTSANRPALLLESADIDARQDTRSLLLIDAALECRCLNGQISLSALSANGRACLGALARVNTLPLVSQSTDQLMLALPEQDCSLDEDSRLKQDSIFTPLRALLAHISPIREHPHGLFLGGVIGFDALASIETLPDVACGPNPCPDYLFYLAETLVIIDHQKRTTEVLSSVFSGPEVEARYLCQCRRHEAIVGALESITPGRENRPAKVTLTDVEVNISDCDFAAEVAKLQQQIHQGEIFQVVPSRRFSMSCSAPLAAYRQLKELNPSPYLFFLNAPDFALFGASPESALKFDARSRQLELYPIAGTRPRGKQNDGSIDADLDGRLELELRQDSKEMAEHMMLVDLARNDIARVAEPGSRYVKDLLKVDRYSHVMHLVSRVVGKLRPQLDALHAYQACMNMGTLSGAPKLNASRLIRQVEGQRRGSYGGAIGYLNGNGDMDSCIVIRSALVHNGTAQVQAGAGVVADSDPLSEAAETRHKANAVLLAIAASEQEPCQ